MNILATCISDFLRTGKFSNNIDTFGNVNLNVSSSKLEEVCIAFTLNNNNYDTEKIVTLYDATVPAPTNITTNITTSESLQNSYDAVFIENQQNKTKLADLASIIENIDLASSPEDMEDQKMLIIKLRKEMGQGVTSDDFSNIFPYEPISK
jgi:hypothetical protein